MHQNMIRGMLFVKFVGQLKKIKEFVVKKNLNVFYPEDSQADMFLRDLQSNGN